MARVRFFTGGLLLAGKGGETVPYLCGYQGNQAVNDLTGIAAVLQSRAVTLPAGGDLCSTVAMEVSVGSGSPLLMRYGFGAFRTSGKADQQLSIFYELINGPGLPGDRELRLLGKPGQVGDFHSYTALFDSTAGQWQFLFDGNLYATSQNPAWQGREAVLPAFVAQVSVLEAPVMGESSAPCNVEACRLQAAGLFTDVDFSATSAFTQTATVGSVTLRDGITNAFSLAATVTP